MSTDSPPSFSIKKRKGPKASTSKLSFGGGQEIDSSSNNPSTTTSGLAPEGEEEGSAVVIRNRGKKTPAGRTKDKKLGFRGPSTSFDVDGEDSNEPPTFVKRALSSTSASSATPRRGLLRTTLSQSTSIPTTSSLASTIAAPPTPSSSSVYSKEYLDQLKNSQLTAPKPTNDSSTSSLSIGNGGNGGEYDDLTMSKFGSGTNVVDDPASTIPTTNAIAQAKARREELRKTGHQADDFISLSGSVSTVGFANKGGDSRLVREEDELGDGDEDLADFTGSMEKVPLGRKANREAAIRMRGEMGELIEDVEGEVSEEDEEMKRWEEAQIKRGGEGDRAKKDTNGSAKKSYRPTPIPQSSTLPSLTAVTSRLSLSLSTLSSSHTLDSSSLDHFTRERQELDKQESELRSEVERIEKKSRWFEEFKETVEDWDAFLDEKFPQLERIENEYLDIQKERCEIISKRRFADDSDDVSLFTGSSIPTDRAKLFANSTEEDAMMKGEEEEDLAPRSITRTTRRAERLRRCEEGTSSTLPSAYPDPLSDPGYLSDTSLSPTDTSDLSTALSSLHSSLTDLFKDVKVDDFRDPNLGIRKKFEEWRELWREEYGMLFGALGLVGVWEFWARVEMASWNPFEIEQLPNAPSDLSQYAWHQALTSYGHPAPKSPSTMQPEEDDEEPLDESTEVVNALVTSVVIPRLEKLARESYDPFSSRQTVAALRLVDEISYCVEKDSPKFESLIQAFLYRLRLEIHSSQSLLLPHTAQLSVPSLSYDPSTFLARQHFLSRQLKLVRTCLRWRRFMRSLRLPVQLVNPVQPQQQEGDGVELPGGGEGFDELIVRELVGRVVLPVVEVSWATGGEESARKVLDILPKDDKVVSPALRRRLQGEGVQ